VLGLMFQVNEVKASQRWRNPLKLMGMQEILSPVVTHEIVSSQASMEVSR
jgi:hypothetical protein